MESCEAVKEKRINEKKEKFRLGEVRRAEAGKKLRSILFLALGKKGKKYSVRKILGLHFYPSF